MGTKLGPYEILSPIGAGGMGEVYLANDSKLDRSVAIKVLPESMTRDLERVARFEREAKLLASLNHPHIAAVHGFDESNGTRFLVMEYVEGQTLAQRLREGALGVDDALEIGKQIAEALEAAHDKGVIHRDLKPANVMIRPDGSVKVLDFGLAKAMSEDSSSVDQANSPTITADFTRPGVVLGTAAYMSPEQARGRTLDKRSDIWSFGIILFECLTGDLLFRGETANDSMGAIMHKEPDWSLLPVDTPPTVQLLLRRCLVKDRRRRLQAIGDARVDIEDAIADPSSSSLGLAQAVVQTKDQRRVGLAAVVILAIIATAAATYVLTLRLVSPAPKTAMLVLPATTSQFQGASQAVISPDGRSLVFSATGTQDNVRRLWIRRLEAFDSTPLLETRNVRSYFWSDDSQSIGFYADGKLWSINVRGGGKRLLAANVPNSGASWAGDVILVGDEAGELVRVQVSGGTPDPATTIDSDSHEIGHLWPHFLPDGNRYLFLAVTFDPSQETRSHSLYAGALDSEETTFIGNLTSGVWYTEAGYLIYVDNGTIKAVPFDERSLSITGPPSIISDGAGYFKPIGRARLSVSRDGSIVFEPTLQGDRLTWFDETGSQLSTLGDYGSYDSFRLSPDGSKVVLSVEDPRTLNADVWIYGLTRNTTTRLTFDARWEGDPVWSPDGTTVYFAWDRDGPPDIFSMPAQGGSSPELVFRATGPWFPNDVSPDGQFLLIRGPGSVDTGTDLWIVPLRKDEDPHAFIASRANERAGRFSPDGRWIAYTSDVSGEPQVYLQEFPGPGRRIQVSIHGGANPVWAHDGQSLYFGARSAPSRSARIMVVDLVTPQDFDDPMPRMLFDVGGRISQFEVAPDGERFLLNRLPDDLPPCHVILNWSAERKD